MYIMTLAVLVLLLRSQTLTQCVRRGVLRVRWVIKKRCRRVYVIFIVRCSNFEKGIDLLFRSHRLETATQAQSDQKT